MATVTSILILTIGIALAAAIAWGVIYPPGTLGEQAVFEYAVPNER